MLSELFKDTLAKRIFALMWVSLVASHLIAHQVVMGFVIPEHPVLAKQEDLSIPSLPPIPGLDTERGSQLDSTDPPSMSPRAPQPAGASQPQGNGTGPGTSRRDMLPRDARGNGGLPPGFAVPGGGSQQDGAAGGPDGPLPEDRGGSPTALRQQPDRGPGPGGEAPNSGGHPPIGAGPAPLPTHAVAIDYAIRITIIALCSIFGARWLAQPMKRLVDASTGLGQHLGQGGEAPMLDERHGTIEVRKAASVFNLMARQLSEQFRSRELLVAALSHDLRTPLTRIRIRLEPLPESAVKQKSISDIQEMNTLIDESMEVFRNTSASEPMKKTDVYSICESVVEDAIEQRHMATISGESTIVQAKPMALRRVLTNLVNNAIRYGGNAIVTVRREPGGVSISVEDDGPGIPESQLANVMQPFFRLETSRSRATGGSGLGLYIARDLALKQGGCLTLENRQTGGLRAALWLPTAA